MVSAKDFAAEDYVHNPYRISPSLRNLLRKTDLPPVSERSSLHQSRFANRREIACGPGELASTAGDVNGIFDDRKQGLAQRQGNGGGWVHRDCVARVRNPMVLHVKGHRSIRVLYYAKYGCCYRS